MSTNTLARLIFAALIASGSGAAADLPMAAEALVHHTGNGIEGCGVRITGGRVAARSRSIWLDLSFNVYRRGPALVQAIAYDMQPSRYGDEVQPNRIAVQRAWVKPRSAGGSTRLGENTQTRDAVVYAVTLDDAAALFQASASLQPIVVGVRAWNEQREWVFEGTPVLTDPGRAQLADCLTALVN